MKKKLAVPTLLLFFLSVNSGAVSALEPADWPRPPMPESVPAAGTPEPAAEAEAELLAEPETVEAWPESIQEEYVDADGHAAEIPEVETVFTPPADTPGHIEAAEAPAPKAESVPKAQAVPPPPPGPPEAAPKGETVQAIPPAPAIPPEVAAAATKEAEKAGEDDGRKVAAGFFSGTTGKATLIGAGLLTIGIIAVSAGGGSTSKHP